MASLTLKRDPTRTTLLRRAFEAELQRRFDKLKRKIRDLVERDDVFGLLPPIPFRILVEKGAWKFLTSEQKVQSYKTWLKDQIAQDILSVDQGAPGEPSKPWTSKYVESSFRKGVQRAFEDMNKLNKTIKAPDFFEGTREEFLRQAFTQPERLSKVQLLATRTLEALEGVTSSMAAQMNVALAGGIAQGKHPSAVARDLTQKAGISAKRGKTVARTEMIHAHAEGQLDGFEELDEDEIGIMSEWSTASDDKVCYLCAANEGRVFKISEARGKIPLHPNCRCAWIPADMLAIRREKKRKERLQREAKKALDKGVRPDSPFEKPKTPPRPPKVAPKGVELQEGVPQTVASQVIEIYNDHGSAPQVQSVKAEFYSDATEWKKRTGSWAVQGIASGKGVGFSPPTSKAVEDFIRLTKNPTAYSEALEASITARGLNEKGAKTAREGDLDRTVEGLSTVFHEVLHQYGRGNYVTREDIAVEEGIVEYGARLTTHTYLAKKHAHLKDSVDLAKSKVHSVTGGSYPKEVHRVRTMVDEMALAWGENDLLMDPNRKVDFLMQWKQEKATGLGRVDWYAERLMDGYRIPQDKRDPFRAELRRVLNAPGFKGVELAGITKALKAFGRESE